MSNNNKKLLRKVENKLTKYILKDRKLITYISQRPQLNVSRKASYKSKKITLLRNLINNECENQLRKLTHEYKDMLISTPQMMKPRAMPLAPPSVLPLEQPPVAEPLGWRISESLLDLPCSYWKKTPTLAIGAVDEADGDTVSFGRAHTQNAGNAEINAFSLSTNTSPNINQNANPEHHPLAEDKGVEDDGVVVAEADGAAVGVDRAHTPNAGKAPHTETDEIKTDQQYEAGNSDVKNSPRAQLKMAHRAQNTQK
jgi:hypothetical protein